MAGTIRFVEEDEANVPTPPAGYATLFVDSNDDEVAVRKDDGSLQKFLSSVSSVFGRTGDVVAAASDYDASQVDNDSGVAGATVADALDQLDSDIAALAPIFTESFTSADQVITSSGTLTIAHGLSSAPIIIIAQLVCVTAENNFSPGDVINIGYGTTSGVNRLAQVRPDATNLNVIYGSSGSVFTLLDETSGVRSTITNANWRLRLTAFA